MWEVLWCLVCQMPKFWHLVHFMLVLTNRTKQPHKVENFFSSLVIFRFFLVFRIKLTQSLIDWTPSSWILIGHPDIDYTIWATGHYINKWTLVFRLHTPLHSKHISSSISNLLLIIWRVGIWFNVIFHRNFFDM